jgi:lysophospholipase L1-like esterase
VAEVAARYHVRYYDATEDLRAQMGNTPDKYYLPNDMHFTADGYRLYGIAVAKYLSGALDYR